MNFASQLISPNVVVGYPEQRMSSVARKIKDVQAHYCAVLKPKTYTLVGLVRFSDVIGNPSSGSRIFADLMRPAPPDWVQQFTPVEQVMDLLKNDPTEIVVTRESGEFAGLITPNSFSRWLLVNAPPIDLGLERIPPHSRWHPYPQAAGENNSAVA